MAASGCPSHAPEAPCLVRSLSRSVRRRRPARSGPDVDLDRDARSADEGASQGRPRPQAPSDQSLDEDDSASKAGVVTRAGSAEASWIPTNERVLYDYLAYYGRLSARTEVKRSAAWPPKRGRRLRRSREFPGLSRAHARGLNRPGLRFGSAAERQRSGRTLHRPLAPRVVEALGHAQGVLIAGRMEVLTLLPFAQAETRATPGRFLDRAFAEGLLAAGPARSRGTS